ncbi:MAG: DUF1376 domain-containing protein [Patescibacteria group bacterium]|nr:DUF1376 domain-containing protein [Patescibacteria group bacterium]
MEKSVVTEQLPEPPISPDVDLRDYDFMPLKVATLRDSAIVDRVSGDEFRAAVLLWCASWHQVPAGSLPDDDVQLAKFAGYGRVLKEWQKVRRGALYGFVKCSDGRLYHPVVVAQAMSAFAGKRSASVRGKAGADARWGGRDGSAIRKNGSSIQENGSAIIHDGTSNASAIKRRCNSDGNRDGEGEGEGIEDSEEGKPSSGAAAPKRVLASADGKPDWWPRRDRYDRITAEITEKLVYDVGKAVLGKSAGGQITRLRKLYHGDMRAVTDLLLQADDKSDPGQWVARVIQRAEDGEHVKPAHEKFPERIYP